MSEDTTPTPEPTNPQEPAAAAPEPPKATPEPPKETSPWDDPAAAKAEIERLRRENASSRTNAKATAAEEARKELAQTIGKALGLVEDAPVDPAALTEQVAKSQAAARQAQLELAVFHSASDADTAKALLDSRSFLAEVADIDPSDREAIAAAIGKAVNENPALGKRRPAPTPGQGAAGSGPAAVAQLTQADLKTMTSEQIVQAQKEGRLASLGYGVKRT